LAHEQAQAPSLRFPCQGGQVDPDGLTYSHSVTCDKWMMAIEARDRSHTDELREVFEAVSSHYVDALDCFCKMKPDEPPCIACMEVARLQGRLADLRRRYDERTRKEPR